MAQLTLWQAAYPASPGASQESDGAMPMTVTSGLRCAVLWRSTSPLGCLLRTLLASPVWRSTAYSLTWEPMGTKHQRLWFRLRPSARPISASASLSWPTVTMTAGDGRSEQSVETWLARRERTLREKGVHNGLPLNVAVKMWPTPVANDGRKMTPPSEAQRGSLTAALLVGQLWSTPAAQDAKNATLPASQATRDTLPGDLLREAGQTGVMGSLNPEWAEILMGYPEGWTELDEPTQRMRSSRHAMPGLRSEVKHSTHGSRRASRKSASPTARRD